MKTTITALIIALSIIVTAQENKLKDFTGIAGIKFGDELNPKDQLVRQSQSRMMDNYYLKKDKNDKDILVYYKVSKIDVSDTPSGFSTVYVMVTPQSKKIHTIILEEDGAIESTTNEQLNKNKPIFSKKCGDLFNYFTSKYGKGTYGTYPCSVYNYSPIGIIAANNITVNTCIVESNKDFKPKSMEKIYNKSKIFIMFTDPAVFNQCKTEATNAINFDRSPAKK